MELKRIASILMATTCITFTTCSSVFAQTSLPSERRIQIESRASRWQEVKSKARRTKNEFLSTIAQDSRFDYRSFQGPIAEAWSICEGIEQTERNRQEHLSRLLDEELSKGEISLGERVRRGGIVAKIFQIRMLFTYGNLMPRILDESTAASGQQGRLFAGPEWEVVLSQEEMNNLHGEYRKLSGFSSELDDKRF